jgi:hypothetical protein
MNGSQVHVSRPLILKVRLKRIPVLLLLALAAAILIGTLAQQKRGQVFVMSDGTRVTIKVGERGQPLRIFEGQFWQRPFYELFGTNISRRLGGRESIYSVPDSNATAVLLVRFYTNMTQVPWNGGVQLIAINRDGMPQPGWKRSVNYVTKQNKGSTKVTAEEIYWEFSNLDTNATEFLFCCTNQIAEPFALEFKIRK